MNRPKQGCGSCYACCKTHGIKELKKVPGELCGHCKPGRKACQIYKKRPKECMEFKCFWLATNGTGPNRPDRLGVVIDAYNNTLLDNLPVAAFFEYIPGKLKDERVLKHARDALRNQVYLSFMKLDRNVTVFFPDSYDEENTNIGILPEGTVVGTREELGV